MALPLPDPDGAHLTAGISRAERERAKIQAKAAA
jgi:hypothetical protein